MTPARLGRATPAREAERRPLPIMRCSGWRVEILETNFPLSTTSRYRKTERGGPWGHKATSGLQGRVEPVPTACRAECAAVVGAKRAGVRAIGGESRSMIFSGCGRLRSVSGARRHRRRAFASKNDSLAIPAMFWRTNRPRRT